MAEARDFTFGILFGFARVHRQLTLTFNSVLGKLPKYFRLPYNIFALVETSDFKFGFPFNIFAMADIAMGVPSKRY